MPINRITGPNSTPTVVGDYQAQNNQIGGLILREDVIPWTGTTMTDGLILQVGGTLYKVEGTVTITGTESDYVRIVPAGATATAEFVSSWAGVTWSASGQGYYDGSGNRYFARYWFGARVFEQVGPWTGTFVPPKGVEKIILTMCGAGGDGASTGGGSQPRGGGGGGSGAWCFDEVVDVTDGAEYPIVLSDGGFGAITSSAFGADFGPGGSGAVIGGTSGGSGAGGSGGVGTSFAKNGARGGNGVITGGSVMNSGGGAGFMQGGDGEASTQGSGSGGSYIKGVSGPSGSMAYNGKAGDGTFANANGTDATTGSFMSGGGGASATSSGGLRSGGHGGYGAGGGGAASQGGTIGATRGDGGPAYIRITW